MIPILVGAVLGYLAAGLGGLFIGGLVGYVFQRGLRSAFVQNAHRVETHFVDATFAVMGALCKADGQVTRDEIQVAEHLFDQLHLAGAQREAAKAAFNRGKAPGFDPEAEVEKLASVRFRSAALLRVFLQVQCMAIAADGRVHPAEHEMLVRVANRLGLSERDVAQLEALLRAASEASGAAPADRLADAYTALGVSPDANVADIKRVYRKLMSENHPDKLAAKGLPESMRDAAEERTREINVAYRLIQEARGFS